jgi:heat shock protein HtpX
LHNHLRTFTLLAALTALFVSIGFMIGGFTGMVIALLLASVGNLVSYWNADKIVLRMYGATEVDESHPGSVVRDFVHDVHVLADNAGLPRPRNSPTPSPPAATRNMRRWPRPSAS